MSQPTVTTPTYEIPAGYIVRWKRPSYHLLKATATDADPMWKVACVKHGSIHDAKTQQEAEKLGRQADRDQWCKGCGDDAKTRTPKTTTPKTPGVVKVTVSLVVEVDPTEWVKVTGGDDAPDLDALLASIKALGVSDETAAELAAGVVNKAIDTADLKVKVSDLILTTVKGLDQITASGATVTAK